MLVQLQDQGRGVAVTSTFEAMAVLLALKLFKATHHRPSYEGTSGSDMDTMIAEMERRRTCS